MKSLIVSAAICILLLGLSPISPPSGATEACDDKRSSLLSADEVKQLRVEWAEPVRKTTVEHAIRGSNLVLAGSIYLLQEDGTTRKPIDWPLEISVYLSRRPGRHADWGRVLRSDEVLKNELQVGMDEQELAERGKPPERRQKIPFKSGRFTTTFKTKGLNLAPGRKEEYQIAVAVAQRGKWPSGLVEQTVTLLHIEGPQPISETMQIINGCPSPDGPTFEPAYLIRAVNHLRAMGKEKAIAALREFRNTAGGPELRRELVIPANLDTSNEYCLGSLIPLLFPNLWDRNSPRPANTRHVADFIRVQSDLPFLTGRVGFHSTFYAGGEHPHSMRSLVDAAEKKGLLLDKPMRPPDAPLEAAEALCEQLRKEGKLVGSFGRVNETQQWIREQAWRTLKHLAKTSYEDPLRFAIGKGGSPEIAEQRWAKLKAEVAKLNVRWDEQKQEYVAGAN
jgi:hypothetical protein